MGEIHGVLEKEETEPLPERVDSGKELGKLPDTVGENREIDSLPDELKIGENDSEKIEKSKLQPPICITFDCPPTLDHEEFKRQIEGQEAGMNKLTVQEFLDNRERYKESGRNTDIGAPMQKSIREKALQDEIAKNQEKGMSYSDAKAEALESMRDKAALHDPDQIAGGNPENVTGMGDAATNSSIGSQWKSRINSVEDTVREKAMDMTQEERNNTYLNVKLEVR